jgi:hypothetical protein
VQEAEEFARHLLTYRNLLLRYERQMNSEYPGCTVGSKHAALLCTYMATWSLDV